MGKTFHFGPVRRVGNAALATLITTGLAPSYYFLLTVRGRKSGQPRTIPIRLFRHSEQEWLVSPYGIRDWVRNARAAGEVTLRRGKSSRTVPVVECGAQEAAPVLRAYAKAEPVTRPYFDAKLDDPVEQFAAEAARHPVFRVG